MKLSPDLRSTGAGMKWLGRIWILLLALNLPARADFAIARGGSARCVIVQQPGATLAESNAVRELAGTLEKITGARFVIQETKDHTPKSRSPASPRPGRIYPLSFSARSTAAVKIGSFG